MRDMSREPSVSAEIDLGFRTGPVHFSNPIFTASGTWGYGLEFTDLVDPAQLGGVVSKTLTVEPRAGNPQPRVRELAHGMLNSIGLENVGLEVYLEEKLPRLRERGVTNIVSLAGREPEELPRMIERLAGFDGWAAVELNLSCPNVARGGLDFGREPRRIEEIVSAARGVLPADRALWVKLTPNVSSIGELGQAAESAGAHALSCINTVVGLDVDLERMEPVYPRGVAGYSGPAILPIALAKVWEVVRAVQIPVVGIGGIGSLADVLKFFVVGAGAVQVGTSLFARPDLANRFPDLLAEELRRRSLTRVEQLRSRAVN